jgi:heavy metal sensor kinase
LDDVYHEVNRLTRTLLTLAPFALLIASIGGAFLTDRALRPVRAVTQAAGRIEATNLSGRLNVTGGDEFAELARTFNGMLRRLEEAFGSLELANERLRRFTADASHELRTPLTIIKAHTSLALAQPRSADEYRLALEIVDSAVDRTACLVQDLLLLARSDAGQLEMPRCPVAVTEIFESALHAARQPAAPPVRLRLPDPPPTVFGNADALARLFGNLVANAVRHTPEDSTVTLSALARGADVVIEVIDTGEGIAPEHLPHVRERFYRADESRSRAQGGAGLGLSICQSIVEAHGGRMEIRSVLGGGTTVTVTLPGALDE